MLASSPFMILFIIVRSVEKMIDSSRIIVYNDDKRLRGRPMLSAQIT